MPRTVEIPFAKFSATGNDFIVVEAAAPRQSDPRSLRLRLTGPDGGEPVDVSSLARAICERRTGVGADGLLAVMPPREKKHLARMRVINADGGEAEMSGNGIRCVAAYLLERGQLARPSRRAKGAAGPSSPQRLQIETGAGVKTLDLIKAEKGRWVFRVGMGEPILAPEMIPFKGARGDSRAVDVPLALSSGTPRVTVTSMGNPHCSIFVDSFEAVDWPALGREIERHDHFPKRTNVEFIQLLSPAKIEVRFWERGVGQTQSSGTGSCAAVVASVLNKRTGRKVRVRTVGGEIEIAWLKKGGLTLTGPVDFVARGSYLFRPGHKP